MMTNLEMSKWRQRNAQEISCNISTYKCGSTLGRSKQSTCQNNRSKTLPFLHRQTALICDILQLYGPFKTALHALIYNQCYYAKLQARCMIPPIKFQQNWFDLFPPSLRLLPTELFTLLSILTISHPFAITFEDRLFYKFLVLSSLLKTWRRACILIENDDICKLGLCFQSQESIFKHLIYTTVRK